MAAKKTGISLDLIIHPGETIADVLEERGLTQVELAARTGVTPAYISNVISGKKNISANFAMSLEYALGVPKSFWLNLQANYDAELLEYNEEHTITEEEKNVRKKLSEIIKYLRDTLKIPEKQSINDNILSLRNIFQVSNLCNLKDLVPSGAFRLATSSAVDPYVLGAWLRICQMGAKNVHENQFDVNKVDALISELKAIMIKDDCDLQTELATVMMKYGIDFSVVHNFRGAPVHGYICQKSENRYQMTLTIRGAYADIFWFSLFHEIKHVFQKKKTKVIINCDDFSELEKEFEDEANDYATDTLIPKEAYHGYFDDKGKYISKNDVKFFARHIGVHPGIVVGRLQHDDKIAHSSMSDMRQKYMIVV